MIEQSNISETVASIIKDRIGEDEFPSGRRLHIRKLAQELGVSPKLVREALNRLIAEGLAESIPGWGIFVANPSQRDIAEMLEAHILEEAAQARPEIVAA